MWKRRIREKKNKGFTLVELVIVIAILAILVGILAPQYTRYVEKTRKAADANNMDELVKAVKAYAIEGTNQLISTEYTLIIGFGGNGTNGGSSINATGKILFESGDKGNGKADSKLADALNEQFPNWRDKLRTKSKKWGTDGKAASIQAIITIESDGGISVSYKPEKFAKYMAGES